MIGPWLNTNLPIYLPYAANPSHSLGQRRVAWFLTIPGLDAGRRWHSLAGNWQAVFSGMAAGNGWVSSRRPGGFGAVRFGGSDSAACVASDARDYVAVGADITVGTWIYPTTAIGSKVITSWYQGPFNITYDFYLKAGVLTWWDGSTERNSAISPAQNAWTYCAGSRAGTTLTFVTVSTAGVVTTATSAVAAGSVAAALLTIGADNNPNGWIGDLDDISVWSRALSIGEIAEYARLSQRGYPGLLNRIDMASFAGVVAPGGLMRPLALDGLGSTYMRDPLGV